MSIKLRMIFILMVMIVTPEGIALYLLESGKGERLQSFLSIHLAFSLALIVPLAQFCTYLIVGREISALSFFCQQIKNGQFNMAFSLPNEKDDETELIKLKRLLNWMAHSLSVRETQQQQLIGKNEELKNHFQTLSMRDELTRLFNRRYFNKQLQIKVSEALKNGESLSLMFIDIDNFKAVNDTFGHQEGDNLLIMLANVLYSSIRSENDIPFRYGGDEFGIILPGVNAQECTNIAMRIKEQYTASAPEITSLSIGLASLSHNGVPPANCGEELIKTADECVYMAKRNGRNSIVIEDAHQLKPHLHQENG